MVTFFPLLNLLLMADSVKDNNHQKGNAVDGVTVSQAVVFSVLLQAHALCEEMCSRKIGGHIS